MLSDASILGADLNSNGLCLLRNFDPFFMLVFVLIFQNVKFVIQTINDILLTINLCLVVALNGCNAYVDLLLSPFKVFNMSLEIAKVSLQEFMRFNLTPVSGYYIFSDAIAHLNKFTLLALLVLHFLKLKMLTVLSLFAMLFIEAVSLSLLHNRYILSLNISLW